MGWNRHFAVAFMFMLSLDRQQSIICTVINPRFIQFIIKHHLKYDLVDVRWNYLIKEGCALDTLLWVLKIEHKIRLCYANESTEDYGI